MLMFFLKILGFVVGGGILLIIIVTSILAIFVHRSQDEERLFLFHFIKNDLDEGIDPTFKVAREFKLDIDLAKECVKQAREDNRQWFRDKPELLENFDDEFFKYG